MMDLDVAMISAEPDHRSVLLVEDDDYILDSFTRELEESGFSVTAVSAVTDAVAILSAGDKRFDAIVLDLGLPDGDGRQVCYWLRQNRIMMPVLLVTGNDDDDTVDTSFAAGACDYIHKPCQIPVLIAKVRAALASFDRSRRNCVQIGNWEFRASERSLFDRRAGKQVTVTVREAALLQILCENDGRSVPRSTLLDQVWGYKDCVRTHTIESHVYRLRRKIEQDPANATILLSCDGGYRLGGLEQCAA